MTDDEKRQQKASLLLEYQETEDELRHLYERSHVISSALDALLRVIRPDLGVLTPQSLSDLKALQNVRQALDLDAMLGLAGEIRRTKHKLKELQARKEALGLR